MEQEEICTVEKCWHHVFIKIIMVIQKYYYFDCNGTGMESTEGEGTHAVGNAHVMPSYKDIAIKR